MRSAVTISKRFLAGEPDMAAIAAAAQTAILVLGGGPDGRGAKEQDQHRKPH